jgi:SAM-dependent methyltransferase
MGRRTDIKNKFDSSYYDKKYFADPKGKQFLKPDGSIAYWGYQNSTGEWLGCQPITKVWKDIFKLGKCDTDSGLCKVLDVGCGRGQFVTYLRDIRVEAWGFDYSSWAIQNPYSRCQKGWTVQHDATKIWTYGDKAFDLVIALDLFEHIYSDNISDVISEMYRVSKKWIFLQIAGINGGSGAMIHDNCYLLRRGEEIPVKLQGMAVAGHVTVQTKIFWKEKLENSMNNDNKFIFRGDMVQEFIKKVPADVIENWTKNIIIILERV